MNNRCPAVAVVIYIILGYSALFAADGTETGTATVIMNDRSQLLGRVVSLADGIYVVETQSLGTVKVRASKVAAVVYDPSLLDTGKSAVRGERKPAASSQRPLQAVEQYEALLNFEGLFQKLTSDPQMMQKIEKLQSDPDVKALLNDPAVMKAIESGDFSSLMNNPKIQKLLDNPSIKDITQGLGTGE